MAEQPIQHLEPILDAARDALRAGLPSAVAAVNAAHQDFQLDEIPSEHIFVGGFTTAVYPMIEIAAPDWTMTRLSVAQFDSSLDLPLAIKITCLDMTSEALYRRLLRYCSAVIAVLLAPDAIPNVDIDRDRGIRGAYRFNPETDEIQELDGSAMVVFYLEAVETRT